MLLSRRAASLLATAGLTAAVGVTAAACTPTDRPCPSDPVTPGLAVAVGAHANSARPAWPVTLDREVDAVARVAERHPPGPGITLVRVDGRPAIGCVMTFDADANNETAQRRAREVFAAVVRGRVAALTAAVPESNPLEALSVAAAAAGPGGTVVLVDSGLQTVAPLDFRQRGLLAASTDAVVDALARARQLPDLSNRKVFLVGIGYTAAPQPALDESRRAHLIDLWQRIASKAGARLVEAVTVPSTSPPAPGLPRVSIVPVPPAGALDLGCNTESVLPDSGPVGFGPESTDFVDPTAARAVLARFAGWLVHNPQAHAIVTGSIAHYGPAGAGGGLSQARAERVRGVLVDLGAGPSQVTAAGVGWGPFPTASAPPDPQSDPLNRRVVIQLRCR